MTAKGESHAPDSTEVVYVAGDTPKGAMTGTVTLKQRIAGGTVLATLDEAGAPAFKNRVGGHVQTQAPPDGWTSEDQAQYYVDHHVNVVWGEKFGRPNLSPEITQRYGLGLALEVTLPPVDSAWRNDPANCSAVYTIESWSGPREVISPFDDRGRLAYYDAFRAAMDQNPDVRVLDTLFGDYSFTTDETGVNKCDPSIRMAKTRQESALEVMAIMKWAISDAGKTDTVTPTAWLWHLGGDYAGFLTALRDMGVGQVYNESGDGDDWINRRTNVDGVSLRTGPDGKSLYGPDYAVLVSAGGSCESIDRVLGLPTPHASAMKLSALAEAGVENFFRWWGSNEGWSYSVNMAVVRDLVTDPTRSTRTTRSRSSPSLRPPSSPTIPTVCSSCGGWSTRRSSPRVPTAPPAGCGTTRGTSGWASIPSRTCSVAGSASR